MKLSVCFFLGLQRGLTDWRTNEIEAEFKSNNIKVPKSYLYITFPVYPTLILKERFYPFNITKNQMMAIKFV